MTRIGSDTMEVGTFQHVLHDNRVCNVLQRDLSFRETFSLGCRLENACRHVNKHIKYSVDADIPLMWNKILGQSFHEEPVRLSM